jgi:hypothetical protein
MKYQANPVIVEAQRIVVTEIREGRRAGNGEKYELDQLVLRLEDGSDFEPTRDMMSRMKPVAGDYVVTQADGYTYLNPKSVFEHKYSPLPVSAEKAA